VTVIFSESSLEPMKSYLSKLKASLTAADIPMQIVSTSLVEKTMYGDGNSFSTVKPAYYTGSLSFSLYNLENNEKYIIFFLSLAKYNRIYPKIPSLSAAKDAAVEIKTGASSIDTSI